MYTMTDDEFEEAVQDAIDSIPDAFLEALDNVMVTVQNEPNARQRMSSGSEGPGGEILGLYEGVALTQRGEWYGEGEMPDVVTIFKGPHERCFNSRERIVEEIRKTVVHEIGHHFGMDDAALRRIGY
ncbi:Zn-dependent protease [Slackia equolifaciens]|uniref:Metallopeptidase family protein n=1 Tax=Slackia equolifaciens TaxID=498718 RepID=A0A3N0AZN6_9ACTN|nr:metallopeptidase family protein [Slackia equolifaciens]RNL40345.1 Zn-dependent protease [Slackia equolifaciens]HJF66079.1 metallopeptidase family protein [Slackia equolifaciens]